VSRAYWIFHLNSSTLAHLKAPYSFGARGAPLALAQPFGRTSPKPCEMLRRLLFAAFFGALATAVSAGPAAVDAKLDRELRQRAEAPAGHSRVILQLVPGVSIDEALRQARATLGRRLTLVGGQVADVPDTALDTLAALSGVRQISLDRRIEGTLERTGATIGSSWVHDTLGLDGSGVGIALIDSGVASWHDDLGSDRVARFVDFVNFQPTPYDDYGHGTHVAGILAGNGYDSGGRRRGIAPGATLLVEKVLDASGQGYISNVIAALDYAVANKDALHLRVVNVSLAAGVYESYTTDPLTLAAKRAVEAGLVVVSAAGNLGRGHDGLPQYGGIGAPGNAPWVITVGASSHNGTVDRSDDSVAGFSSRGPSAIDYLAKPDLVAPGVGIESLTDPGTTLYQTKPAMRLWGTVSTATEPYLSLSGTSMAAPVVAGTIALMLQANPALTPNLVKAILQYTAEEKAGYDNLVQGGGFLNARGAVELAQALAAGRALTASALGDPTTWSGHVIWGNQRVAADQIRSTSGAWRPDVVWGSAQTPDGQAIVVGTSESDNVVWGVECGGVDCSGVAWSSTLAAGAGAFATSDEQTEDDNIVWGSNALDESDSIVWQADNSRVPTPNSQEADSRVAALGVVELRAAERHR
jgi:serine protease AprX